MILNNIQSEVMKKSKILFYPGERWVVIRGRRSAQGEKYAVSNHGRLVKFDETIKKGSLLKGRAGS